MCTVIERTSIIDFEKNGFNNKMRLHRSKILKKNIYLVDIIKRACKDRIREKGVVTKVPWLIQTWDSVVTCLTLVLFSHPSLYPFIYPSSISF